MTDIQSKYGDMFLNWRPTSALPGKIKDSVFKKGSQEKIKY